MTETGRKARLALLSTGGERPRDAEYDRRVTKRGAISRDRIIDAAQKILAEGGYSAMSISAVCKEAGVSAASLYHHFGDKAGLMKAMIEDSIVFAARQFYEAFTTCDHPLDQIQSYVDIMKELGRDYRGNTIGVLAALGQGCVEAPEMREAIADARTRAWAFVAAELNDQLDIEDGFLIAHLQFAFATYIIHVAQSSDTRDDVRALYRSFHRILIITTASLRPELTRDPRFAAALAEATLIATPDQPASERGD